MSEVIFTSKASQGYDAEFMEACRDALRVTPDDLMTGHYLVACLGQKIIGTACLRSRPNQTGEIGLMFVSPDAQGQGVGAALWRSVLDHARSCAMVTVTLDADPHAVAFYHAMGCETVGQSPSGVIPGRVLPRMALRL